MLLQLINKVIGERQRIMIILGSLLVCGGCEPMKMLTAPIQERGVSGAWGDNCIHMDILKTWSQGKLGPNNDVDQVEVLVHKGRVLLTGTVRSKAIKEQAVRDAQRVKGIRKLIDEIQVCNGNFGNYLGDVWIAKKLRALLLGDMRISSQNYHITVVNKNIYLLGTARSKRELQCVMEHTEGLSARRVISHIEMIPPQK